ncbi:hypothetical protein [Demequina litorisediminis]|uniref:Uncharacterized protein n=1 Tax=Demequina litorisediminis TaxID=1849022 RepID=A0ABQ6IE86_9MICO|nr:hypothetical protein [Demequina litorisediminis]GMA35506.1 hypothetical protein GCM10025876_17100 [Demequina litorisediminis]
MVVDNTVSSEVGRDGETETVTANDDYSITPNIPTVTADKEFGDDWVVHGDTSTATITAGVQGDLDVASLTVTEPGTGQFDEAMTFEGFDSGIGYPAGADSASITYTTSAGTFGPVDFADGAIPVLPDDGSTVLSFTVTFTDDDASGIAAGGDPATIPVIIGTDPDDPAQQSQIVNDVTVTGTTPEGVTDSAEADDSLYTYDEHLDALTTKSIAPSTIEGFPGEWIVMQLSGGTAGQPIDGNTDDPYSTVPADQIVITDPVNPPDPFWDAFHPTQIVDVNIPRTRR